MPRNTGYLYCYLEERFALKEVTWEIPNFWDLPTTVDFYVRSKSFRFENATWYLRLYPNGTPWYDSAGYIDMYLVRSQSSVTEHYIYWKICLKTCHGDEYEGALVECTYNNNESEGGVSRYLHWTEIMAQRQLLAPDGKVTVFCQLRVEDGATPEASSRHHQHRNEPFRTELKEASSQTEDPKSGIQTELQEAFSQTEVPESGTQCERQEAFSQTEVHESVSQAEVEEASTSVQKLQSDYSKLLKSEEDSDVSLKVSDKEFRAHRCVLRARSTVFSAMFEHDTEEKASGKVVIEDLDSESFSDFLQHVYAGRVDGLSDENVFNLYFAADKYDLQELKSECREYMKRNLSVDTFCDVMIVAVRHEEEELLKLAIDYFSANIAGIVVTVNWQRFLIDYPTEANELLIKSFVPRKKNE